MVGSANLISEKVEFLNTLMIILCRYFFRNACPSVLGDIKFPPQGAPQLPGVIEGGQRIFMMAIFVAIQIYDIIKVSGSKPCQA